MDAGRLGFLVDNVLVGGGGGAIFGLATNPSMGFAEGDGNGGTCAGERSDPGRREGGGAGAILELLDERSLTGSGEIGLKTSSSTLGDKRPDSLRILGFETS